MAQFDEQGNQGKGFGKACGGTKDLNGIYSPIKPKSLVALRSNLSAGFSVALNLVILWVG